MLFKMSWVDKSENELVWKVCENVVGSIFQRVSNFQQSSLNRMTIPRRLEFAEKKGNLL